jgi:hypothetical protein
LEKYGPVTIKIIPIDTHIDMSPGLFIFALSSVADPNPDTVGSLDPDPDKKEGQNILLETGKLGSREGWKLIS